MSQRIEESTVKLWLPSPPALRGRRAGDEGARARERTTLIACKLTRSKTPLPEAGRGEPDRQIAHVLALTHFHQA
jgi:hypothetical protein